MFGYVIVDRDSLSDENKKIYQAYYCGLCQRLRTRYGAKGQLLLNYDIVFLQLLLTGLYEPREQIRENFSCHLHPFKKRQLRENELLEYCSSMNVMLAYHNLQDDWHDNHNFIKHSYAKWLQKDYEQAKHDYPRQANAVENYMKKLSGYEQSNEPNVDLVAGLTGEMLGELFAYKKDEWYDELKNLGMFLGKFIYLMDAYEDVDQDIKHGRYNPLIALRQDSSQNFELICNLQMTTMISECAKSFERLPILLYSDILRNILYSGVWSKYHYIRRKREKKQEGTL